MCRILLNKTDFEAHLINKDNCCLEKSKYTIDKLIYSNDFLRKENIKLQTKLFELNRIPNIIFKIDSVRNDKMFPEVCKKIIDKKCIHDLIMEDFTVQTIKINCDICEKPTKLTIGCRTCNYDFCLECYKPKYGTPARCSSRHELSLALFPPEVKNVNVSCELCKEVIKSEHYFNCKECNYSTCYYCFKKLLQKEKDTLIYLN